MKSKFIKIMALTLLLCVLLPAMCFADYSAAEVKLSVSQDFKVQNGKKPEAGETFGYIMTPEDAANPMPAGTDADGSLRFQLSGKGKSSKELSLSFDTTGIYKYVVKSDIPEKHAHYRYDESVYNVTVYITNGADDSLVPVIIIEKGEEKAEAISYNHSYHVETRPRTADDSSMTLWLSLMLLSSAAAALMLSLRKKTY